MKSLAHSVAVLVGLMVSWTCYGQQSPDNSQEITSQMVEESDEPKTNIEYLVTEHNFGKISEGEKVTYNFTFTNTGKIDLLVYQVKAYCGCTVTKYSKAPVAPGKKGFVEVVFDSTGRSGKQEKNIAVTTNTEQASHILTLTGEIAPKNEAPKK